MEVGFEWSYAAAVAAELESAVSLRDFLKSLAVQMRTLNLSVLSTEGNREKIHYIQYDVYIVHIG